MELPESIRTKINQVKLIKIIDNQYYQEELLLLNDNNVHNYYIYIIDNIVLNLDNEQNSYIMWLCDKVEKLDQTKRANIIKGRVSLPDIDVDIPATKRDRIIQYIKTKFGEDKVSQMITIQSMKGRGALKDVLRAHGAVSASEMNLITRHLPEEAKIADELQIMKEETGDASIIRYTLENDDKGNLKDWCSLDKDGKLIGPLARFFEQAIRLEGTKSHQSKHAAGILISPEPLNEICPMVYDTKTKSLMAGLEMSDAEEIGMTKYDVLGLSMLDKVAGIVDILKTGDIENDELA